MSETASRVTEILHLPIQKGVDIEAVIRSMASVMQGVAGVINQYWGVQLEHDDILDIIVEWESLAHHKVYMAPDAIEEVLGILAPLIDTNRPVNVCHIPASPATEAVLSAPTVKVWSFSNIPDISNLEGTIQPFFTELSKSEAHRGVVYGWKIEEENGEKFVALQGWQSVGAHFETTPTGSVKEKFEEAQPFIGEVELHHVNFKKYVA